MVIRDGVVTAGDHPVPGVENGLGLASAVPGGEHLFEGRLRATQVPLLTRLHRSADVGHDSAVRLDVVRHLTARDDVRFLPLRVAEYHRVSAGDHDLGGIVVGDAVADEHRLLLADARRISLELERPCPGVEYHHVALIPGGAVAGPLHERFHHRISRIPLDQISRLRPYRLQRNRGESYRAAHARCRGAEA